MFQIVAIVIVALVVCLYGIFPIMYRQARKQDKVARRKKLDDEIALQLLRLESCRMTLSGSLQCACFVFWRWEVGGALRV
jgi:hypothetical protein